MTKKRSVVDPVPEEEPEREHDTGGIELPDDTPVPRRRRSSEREARRQRDERMRTTVNNPYRTSAASTRRTVRETHQGSTRAERRERREGKENELSQDKIRELLHNPTRFVSEAELRQTYNHVIVDLRNMGLLAAGLLVVLVALALVLPR